MTAATGVGRHAWKCILLLCAAGCRSGAVSGATDVSYSADAAAASGVAGSIPAGASAAGTTTATGVPAGFVFGAYKDVTISANWNTSEISSVVAGPMAPVASLSKVNNITWSFATGECGQETWAGIQADTLAKVNIPAFVAAKKNYILSTGGAAGSFTCTSDAGFSTFLDRYASPNLIGVDFDIEGGQTAEVIDALVQRVQVAQKNEKYKHLRFSFTVATLGGASPGLGDAGKRVMQSIQKAGLMNYYINLMTMDYGSASASVCTLSAQAACDMGKSAVQAAVLLHNEYQVPYSQMELTPMIGGNDSPGEAFTLDDVKTVMAFVKENKLAGVHFWSLDRDKDCDLTNASPICNSFPSVKSLGFWDAFSGEL